MKRNLLLVMALAASTSAYAEVPVFAAKCGAGLNVDTNPKGQVRMNGALAKTTTHPDGQITAKSAGAYVDITPKGSEPPYVTYTAKDKSNGPCEILAFAAPGGGAAAASKGPSHTERAGQGQFDARGDIPCSEGGGKVRQCAFEVAREGGGSATVKVSLPSGKTRFIFFDKGQALGADLSQADGDMTFKANKQGDVFKIRAGKEYYEIFEAVVFGG